ncbi:MAG: hypothetical protein JXR76_24290 [Deltaproteobacteria bacterium]|nr:hypothetical protein [Deltaproteobacteria bacterium]
MKRLFLFVLCIAALVMAACTTMEADEPATEVWTDGLSLEEVVSVMPVTVDLAEPAAPQASNLVKRNIVAADSTTDTAIKITWAWPVAWCTGEIAEYCTSSKLWKIYGQDENGEWQPLPASIVKKTIKNSVTGEFDYEWSAYFSWIPQHVLTYFKVSLPDHNTGALYESIVTFFVTPPLPNLLQPSDIRVSLLEASAKAPSKLYGMVGASKGKASQEVFTSLQNFAGGVDLPSATLVTSQLPFNHPIKFAIETDFSATEWGFANPVVVHESNSSFCKVTEVTDNVPTDTIWRFKFAFEDLPLDKASFEAGGLFDYNDLVFYVDVLK